MDAFTAQQACQLTGCTPHQLRYWDRVDLLRPSIQATGGRPGRRRLYSFRDLVALRVIKSLLDNGMSVQRVRRAWDYLRRIADLEQHLSEVKLVTDGQSIFRIASDDDEVIDALRDGGSEHLFWPLGVVGLAGALLAGMSSLRARGRAASS